MMLMSDWQMPLVRAAAACWPDARWPHWHKYSDRNAVKFASKDAGRIIAPCKLLIQRLAELDVPEGLFPDLELHGAGMHWLPQGGRLEWHHDGERHPLLGWKRELNAVLFLSECDGGELETEHDLVTPVLGEVVIFDASVKHRVRPVTNGDRKTLSLFWWSLSSPGTSEQAVFTGEYNGHRTY